MMVIAMPAITSRTVLSFSNSHSSWVMPIPPGRRFFRTRGGRPARPGRGSRSFHLVVDFRLDRRLVLVPLGLVPLALADVGHDLRPLLDRRDEDVDDRLRVLHAARLGDGDHTLDVALAELLDRIAEDVAVRLRVLHAARLGGGARTLDVALAELLDGLDEARLGIDPLDTLFDRRLLYLDVVGLIDLCHDPDALRDRLDEGL